MVSSLRLRAALAAALTCVLVVMAAPASAWAAGPDRAGARDELRRYLSAHPGGTPINDNEISYGDGALVVTLRAPVGTYGVADCPLGSFCFYEWPNFGYPRGRLSDCGRQALADWQWQYRVESAHYNIGSGYVSFYYHSTRLFDVGAANRVRSDASPYRNWANYVERRCY
ncbi:peptidase inhibitor family I36 protein [Micromonospora sp. NPDC004336]